MSDTHEVRELRRRLKLANRTMGRQGRTICELRGELARTREDHSKIERGELRNYERVTPELLDKVASQAERLDRAHEEIKRLREKLADERTPEEVTSDT